MPTGPTPREMLARLVAFPTVSSRSNLDLIAFVENYLREHGVPSRRVPGPAGKAGLAALVGPSVEGGTVLSAHTDVVPPDGQDWTSDPFTLTERGGRLYGRGTCDMKGFAACALALVPEMLAAGLRRPVILALSRDEEIGCIGAEELIEAMLATFPRPEAVVVGEPSEMRVVTGQKGSWGFRVEVRGHPVHSSQIHTGVSAVMAAARLVAWMSDQMAANARDAAPSPFEPPYTTLHVGTIAGGTASNIAAADCVFTGEVRALPDESITGWRARVLAQAERVEAEMRAIAPDTGIRFEDRMVMPGFLAPPGGAAEALARSLTGDDGRHVVAYQTEAGYFQDRGISTVICGPGSIAQAHQPDEFITTRQLDAGTEFIRRLIGRLAA